MRTFKRWVCISAAIASFVVGFGFAAMTANAIIFGLVMSDIKGVPWFLIPLSSFLVGSLASIVLLKAATNDEPD